MSDALLIGLFVGGRGSRMGGVHKGLLRAPSGGEPLAERALRICHEALPAAERVLVGEAAAYAALGHAALADDPPGIGPLGGLHALLLEAERRALTHAVALSCDLPYFGAELLARLAREQQGALVLAPRDGSRWQPFFARYAVTPALAAVEQTLAAGDRALQRALARLAPVELLLSAAERASLVDWDRPEDLPR
jgi:molybdopterin-guanine dinucleotide biosynthesis protein A